MQVSLPPKDLTLAHPGLSEPGRQISWPIWSRVAVWPHALSEAFSSSAGEEGEEGKKATIRKPEGVIDEAAASFLSLSQ